MGTSVGDLLDLLDPLDLLDLLDPLDLLEQEVSVHTCAEIGIANL